MVTGVASSAARCTNTLLGYYNSLDPRVKTLVTAFKYWAKVKDVFKQFYRAIPFINEGKFEEKITEKH